MSSAINELLCVCEFQAWKQQTKEDYLDSLIKIRMKRTKRISINFKLHPPPRTKQSVINAASSKSYSSDSSHFRPLFVINYNRLDLNIVCNDSILSHRISVCDDVLPLCTEQWIKLDCIVIQCIVYSAFDTTVACSSAALFFVAYKQ